MTAKKGTSVKPVGSFRDPRTKQPVLVIPKKGESDNAAIIRVANKHRVSPASVKR